MKLKVYIASPYTVGDVAQNVQRQLLAADALMSAGYEPFAPLWRHFQNLAHPRQYAAWLASDLEWLALCQVVLRLEGVSLGADAEVAFAQELGLPVLFSLQELERRYPAGREDAPARSRSVAIADRWSWALLQQRYSRGAESGVWHALEQVHPERFLAHEHREAIEWLAHRGLIEMAPDFSRLTILVPHAGTARVPAMVAADGSLQRFEP